MVIVVGVDPSLNGTGLARYENGRLVRTERVSTGLAGHERLERIESQVSQFVHWGGRTAHLAVMEGPSFGSASSSFHQLAGGWWLIAHFLWTQRIPYGIVTPSSAKKYATGKGGASKRDVFEAVTGPSFLHKETWPKSHDEADAVVLAAMGQRWLGRPVDSVPDDRWESVWASQWPSPFVFPHPDRGTPWPSSALI